MAQNGPARDAVVVLTGAGGDEADDGPVPGRPEGDLLAGEGIDVPARIGGCPAGEWAGVLSKWPAFLTRV